MLVGVIIIASLLVWITYDQDEVIEDRYQYEYNVVISTNLSENYTLEIPLIVYAQNQTGLDPTELEYQSASIFRDISTIQVVYGNATLQLNTTIHGTALRIRASGNVTIGFSLAEDKKPVDYNEPTKLSLSMGNYTSETAKRPEKYYLWWDGGGNNISIEIKLNIAWAYSKTSGGNIQMEIKTILINTGWQEVDATIKTVYS